MDSSLSSDRYNQPSSSSGGRSYVGGGGGRGYRGRGGRGGYNRGRGQRRHHPYRRDDYGGGRHSGGHRRYDDRGT